MIENKKDPGATKQARRSGEIIDPRSYVSIAGHIYLRGKDRSRQRELVFAMSPDLLCKICGKRVRSGDGDYDHIRGGSPHHRCDCYARILADGSYCTNVRLVHSMFSKEPCHRQKHGRELHFTRRTTHES
jgi:hypothetical protein